MEWIMQIAPELILVFGVLLLSAWFMYRNKVSVPVKYLLGPGGAFLILVYLFLVR